MQSSQNLSFDNSSNSDKAEEGRVDLKQVCSPLQPVKQPFEMLPMA